MNLENFFPKYPNILKSENPLLNPYDNQEFNDAIVTKKEFESLKLDQFEKLIIRGSGEQYNHQKIISRFLSSVTPYNELLLFHEMGTGKTCTAIAAIEQLRYEKNKHINGAIICAKGTGLLNNFSQELIFSCTDGRYIPENYDKLSDLERTHRTRKITSAFYQFNTFETFAKEIAKLPDNALIERFSNTIFVIDEVHNLREKDTTTKEPSILINKRQVGLPEQLNIYSQFHRLFHLVKESKILLMSGTVMKDDPAEFASVMNLILPLDNQFPVDKEFTRMFFNPNGKIKNDMIQTIERKTNGRISYLKAMSSTVSKVFVGQKIGKLEHFIVYNGVMSDFQSKSYIAAMKEDLKDKNIFLNSRQASLFVFPDGSYGVDGFDKYVMKRRIERNLLGQKRTEIQTTYNLSNDLIKRVNKNLANLSTFSHKFAETIKIILNNPRMNVLVFCEFVNGGGCILFAKILEQFGFSQAKGDEKTKGLRYALLTHQTTGQRKIHQIINRFNKDDNLNGEFISVIIGSRIISEGFTFKNIRKEFIFTPHWNYSETSQVIARGWRLGSHNALVVRGDPNLKVEVYQLVSTPKATPKETTTPSIDLNMYETSEKKDVAMKQIEHIIKINAFDCPLNFERNKREGYDDMRECDYTRCEYDCNGRIGPIPDVSTFNLFYAVTKPIEEGFREYFRRHFSIKLSDLQDMFPQMNMFEIINAIKTFIDKDVRFYDKYGRLSYLRIQSEILFITSDARIPNNDKLASFYIENLIIQNGDSFEQIIKRLSDEFIPTLIDVIFTYPEHMGITISKIPEIVQREILTASIMAEILDIEKNKEIRKNILKFFKGFFDKIEGTWVVWLFRENLGVTCLEENEMKWVDCEDEKSKLVNDYITRKRLTFTNSKIGFYGLYNPKIDEFCLRDVSTLQDQKDMRKITIGRRCADWDQKTLLDITVRRIKLDPPSQFLENIVDYEELSEKVKKLKQAKIPDDIQNIQVMKRFLYWVKRPRSDMCSSILQWMREHDLVEENFDCGTQNKQRVKFAY
jgi:superfamily II DNA or RNA helicase